MDRRELLGVFGATAVGVADATGVAAGAEETAELGKDTGEAEKAHRVWKEENLTGRAYEYFHKLQ